MKSRETLNHVYGSLHFGTGKRVSTGSREMKK